MKKKTQGNSKVRKLKKSVKINVTQKDIDKGEPVDGNHCPIGRAAQRVFHTADVWAYTWQLRVGKKTYPLPEVAKAFIDNFDMGLEPVKPFSFLLEEGGTK